MSEDRLKGVAERILNNRLTRHIVETQSCYQELVKDIVSAIRKELEAQRKRHVEIARSTGVESICRRIADAIEGEAV